MIHAEAGDNRAFPGWESRRLWSLWDMIRISGKGYIELGERLQEARVTYQLDSFFTKMPNGEKFLNEEGSAVLRDDLEVILALCKDLSLSVSRSLVSKRLARPPQTLGEFEVLYDAVMAELNGKLFLFVPPHLASYYEWQDIVTANVKDKFPSSYLEIRQAGDCFALGLNTASVFHSMRAAEIGVRVFGTELDVKFPNYPIELADWQNILDQADSKIVALKAMPRGTIKDDELYFKSQAAIHFRYFKDGWRVRANHARQNYTENQAREALDHIRSFFETLASRLSEG